MDQVIPWKMLCDLIATYRPERATGRKPKSTELMLCIHCLQQCAPDETTILNFRHFLEENDLQKAIVAAINDEHLEDQGLLMKRCTLVDATIISAPSSTKNKNRKRDPDISSTKKGNQYYFGMKARSGRNYCMEKSRW